MPEFTISPDWCDTVYSFTITDADGQLAVQFDANQDIRTFTFFNDDNISLADLDFKDYTVTVKGEFGTTTILDAISTFKLQLKNPCIDPAFV